MRALRLAVLASALLGVSSVSSCAGSGELGYDLHVDWGLTDPTVEIPVGINQFRVLVWQGDGETPDESFYTVSGLDDHDGDGHRELCPGSPDNDCTTSGLRPGVPIRITLEGQDAGGRTTHVGHAGPFVLNHGERRVVDLRMYAANGVSSLTDTTASARFLHTATRLPDGRVLFTGGFTRATSTACPASAPTGSQCFDLTASSDAFVFYPPSGRMYRVVGGMLEARAGHTATLLPDGSVLVAGGAESATMVLSPTEGGFALDFLSDGGGDTFEIFAPYVPTEMEDIDGDGDPGAGGFVGAADDPELAGRLDTERFLHAATLLPGEGARVLLAGGRDSADSFAVFDLERAGGYGVVGSGALAASRAAPAAITIGSGTSARAWVFGGGIASANDELAETWRAGTATDRVGSSESAMGFPDASATDRPAFSLMRANVEIVGGGTHALVLGWLGPRCESGTTTAVYSPATPVLCNYAADQPRSFTVAASTGVAVPTPTVNGHALGASARLDDGRIVLLGGVDSLAMQARNTAELFTGTVSAGVATAASERPPMGAPRALHTTTAIADDSFDATAGEDVPGAAYVNFGGVTISADGSNVTPLSALEVVVLR